MEIPESRFKKVSLSIDEPNVQRVAILAADRSTTVSGMIRILIQAEFDKLQHKERLAR